MRGVPARGRAPRRVPLPPSLRSPWVPSARQGLPVGRVHASALPHTAASGHGLSQEQGQGSGGLGPEVRGGSGLDVAPEALQRGPSLPRWASVSRGVGWRGGFGLRVLSVLRENVLVWTHASGHGQSLPEPRSRLRWPWDPRNSFSASRPSTRPERGAQAHGGSRSRPALRGGATTPRHRRGAGPPGTAAVPRSCVPGVSQAPEVCGAFSGGRSHAGWELLNGLFTVPVMSVYFCRFLWQWPGEDVPGEPG